MIIVGLDLSLTSTGVAVIDTVRNQPPSVTTIRSTGRATATLSERTERLIHLRNSVAEVVAGAGLVVIEGPSFGQSRQQGQHDRAGLWWLIAEYCWCFNKAVGEVPPACRAMYATGKGNAGKDTVLAAVIRRYPTVNITGNDEADALILAAMGARHTGHPIDDLPLTHLRAMDKIRWPETLKET